MANLLASKMEGKGTQSQHLFFVILTATLTEHLPCVSTALSTLYINRNL